MDPQVLRDVFAKVVLPSNMKPNCYLTLGTPDSQKSNLISNFICTWKRRHLPTSCEILALLFFRRTGRLSLLNIKVSSIIQSTFYACRSFQLLLLPECQLPTNSTAVLEGDTSEVYALIHVPREKIFIHASRNHTLYTYIPFYL